MEELEKMVEIANPQHPHCPVVLLLDVSGSMAGEKISSLNEGLRIFKKEVEEDELASKRVDLAIITFGGKVEVVHEFSPVENFEPVNFVAHGDTPMGEAILKGIDMVEERKKQYREKGIDYYRPWIFMITDGEPTDMQMGDEKWREVTRKIHEGERNKKFLFFCVGVEPANFEVLKALAPPERPPVKLKGTRFKELFLWLSKSQIKVSASRVGEKVTLEDPAKAGWGEIEI